MGDFADLKSQIRSDLKRSDLDAQIQTAVLDSIRDHGAERFWFNEWRTFSLPITSGTDEYYVVNTSVPVEDFVRVDWVRASVSGVWTTLDRISGNAMDDLHSVVAPGPPEFWSWYGQLFRFYPIPDQTYPVRISGHVRFIELASDGDSNPWTDNAKSLIRYAALKRLFAFPIRNAEAATGAAAMEQMELDILRRETSRRTRTGFMDGYYG